MNWELYQMGPTVRAYLGLASNPQAQRLPQEAVADFAQFVEQKIKDQAPENEEQELLLLEELVAMGLSQAALTLADSYGLNDRGADFRINLALGAALMLEGRPREAERLFLTAQELRPEETAPYVNLASVYYSLQVDQEAMEWCLAGLKLDSNHTRLWELYYSLELANAGPVAQKVRELADQLGSYRGLSLAAHLTDPEDHRLRAEYLETLYRQGMRDDNYLVEYTAALGLAQQFSKVTTLIWERVHLSDRPVAWQLLTHAIQAHLAAEEIDQGKFYLAMLQRRKDVEPAVIKEIEAAFNVFEM